MRKYRKFIYGLAGVCVILAGLFYAVRHSGHQSGVSVAEVVTDLSAAAGADSSDISGAGLDVGGAAADAKEPGAAAGTEVESAAKLCVYVCGAVVNPGIYYLREGDRVAQAIEAAGGMLPDANAVWLNLALQVADSQKIYVPVVGESMPDGGAGTAGGSAGASDGGVDSVAGSGGLININTADVSLLSSLPGIGEAKAFAIVAYREDKGFFKTVEDIKNVSGIKDASYDRIKDLICV